MLKTQFKDINVNLEDVSEYNVFNHVIKRVSLNKNVIDIGTVYGASSVFFADRVNEVYVFSHKSNIIRENIMQCINIKYKINNLNKDNFSGCSTLDSYNYSNIGLIVIDDPHVILILEGAINTLQQMPIILLKMNIDNHTKATQTFNYIKKLKYNIIQISDFKEWFICQHEDYNKQFTGMDIENIPEHFLNIHVRSYIESIKDLRHDPLALYIIDSFVLNPSVSDKNELIGLYSKHVTPLIIDSIHIDFESPEGYFNSSPCLWVNYEDGDINTHRNTIRCIVRSVNYIVTREGRYIMSHEDGKVRTRNFLLELSPDLSTVNHVELINKSLAPVYNSSILGLEDIRMFDHNKFFCTWLEANQQNIPQICYCTFDPEGNVYKIAPLLIENKLGCEKNWLPWVEDDKVHFIHSFYPLTIYTLENNVPVLRWRGYLNQKIDMSSFRGSAYPIPYNNGWLLTIHQVFYNCPRIYYHRIVWLSKDFRDYKLGKVFCFEKPEIEFNLSIMILREYLYITYSRWDHSAQIGKILLNSIF